MFTCLVILLFVLSVLEHYILNARNLRDVDVGNFLSLYQQVRGLIRDKVGDN